MGRPDAAAPAMATTAGLGSFTLVGEGVGLDGEHLEPASCMSGDVRRSAISSR